MPKWLIVSYNRAGEWCVTDRLRDYRICAYHIHHHGGVHVHVATTSEFVGLVNVASAGQARQVVERYAQRHEVFDLALLRQEVRAWRSASSRR